MYKDLREFIGLVDQLNALRRVDGADPLYEIGGITEVAAGLPDGPAVLFDNIKGFPRGFRVSATPPPIRSGRRWRSASIRRCARLTRSGPDGEAQDAHAAPAGDRQGAAFLANAAPPGPTTWQAASADLAPPRRRAVHRSGPIVIMRDPDGGWINASIYRVQVLATASRSVRPRRPAWRGHRQEILGPGQDLPARGGQRRGPGAVHRRLRIPAGGAVGIRVRRRHQGRADRDRRRAADRPADPGPCRDRVRGRAPADERNHLAGRPFGEFTGYYAAAARPARSCR